MKANRVGVDIGGTFTDLMLIDEKGQISLTKSPSTPKDLTMAIMTDIKKIGLDVSTLEMFGHGTTQALNSLLMRTTAKTGLITTKGFRSLLEIMRTNRPDMYNLQQDKPEPFVPRHLTVEVLERISHTGEVLQALDEKQTTEVVRKLKTEGVKAIAVCLLNSYVNPVHEQKLKGIIEKEYPQAHISLSSQISRQWREFERTSTTVINACTMPVMDTYLSLLEEKLAAGGCDAEPLIIQSNGGMMTAKIGRERPVNTVFCGPAAGVVGATYLARTIGDSNIITYDMGGTTCIVALVERGQPKIKTEGELNRWPITMPMIDVNAIGAGGGSIAWIDAGGALRVGPQSAQAEPGPVCYGRGGTEPTVTDANLLLGRINPDYFIGGEIKLDVDSAQRAVKTKIADYYGMDVFEAANGIIEILISNQARVTRAISLERGYDPREFTLIAFGGGGGLHAGFLAEELGIKRVIVPFAPGHMSCLGQLVADIVQDSVRTYVKLSDELEIDKVNEIYQELEAEVVKILKAEGVSEDRIATERSADIRYAGQEFTIQTPVRSGILNDADITEAITKFNDLHEMSYGYCSRNVPTEFVNLRVSALGRMPKPALREYPKAQATPNMSFKGKRKVFFNGEFVECPLYEWERLRPGNVIEGPAIVEEPGSTIVIRPKHTMSVDKFLNCILELKEVT